MDIKIINIIKSNEAEARRICAQVYATRWLLSPNRTQMSELCPVDLGPMELLPTLFTRLAQRLEAFKQQENEGPILEFGGTVRPSILTRLKPAPPAPSTIREAPQAH